MKQAMLPRAYRNILRTTVSALPLLMLLLCGPATASSAVDVTERDRAGSAPFQRSSSQRREVTLFARSEPGGMQDSKKLIVLEKIGKEPGDAMTVPDLHAANKWLCEAAGGTLDDDYRCSSRRVYRFEDKDALQNLTAHRDAMRSVFRTPGVRSISGPRGAVQLVYMGLPDMELGDDWNRQASATQTYLKANRPRPAFEVPLYFLRNTELVRIAENKCDNCFFSKKRLPDDPALLKQLLDFWHSDCSAAACPAALVLVVDDVQVDADEQLLQLLATTMWDKPLPDIKSKVLELCAAPPTPTTSLSAAIPAWITSDFSRNGAQTVAAAIYIPPSAKGAGPGGGGEVEIGHKPAGCKQLRDR